MDNLARPHLDDFPFAISQTLRFADTDQYGHVTNSVFASLCQSGRIAVLGDPANPLAPSGTQFNLARLEIDFCHEMHWPGTVDIATGIAAIGRSSLTLTQALFCQARCVATARSVVVLTEHATRRSFALSDDLKRKLQWLTTTGT